jgi:hypothetical protein
MMWLGKRWNRTTILMFGCVAFLIGLVVARRHVMISGWFVLPALFLAAAMLRRRTILTTCAVVLCGLLLGVWRGGVYLHELQPYQTLAMQKVEFTATANIDAVYGKNSQLAFVVRNVQFTSPQNLRVPGTIKVGGFGETMVYRGDRLQISGKLYPTRGASQATVGFAEFKTIGRTSSNIDAVRRKFTAGMQSALPEPLASFGLGLLVGQRNTLPADLTQALLMVGLTHIIAVSGYNLTILLQASRKLIGDKSKVVSTAVALVMIFGFLLIAGTSASIVRAAVISILGLSAWYYGRSVRPLLLILLAAAGVSVGRHQLVSVISGIFRDSGARADCDRQAVRRKGAAADSADFDRKCLRGNYDAADHPVHIRADVTGEPAFEHAGRSTDPAGHAVESDCGTRRDACG